MDDEKYVDFKVTWVQYASVKVVKKDAKANAKLAGAVFGLYSDANCTKLITKLPATDANGEASVQIVKTQDTDYSTKRIPYQCNRLQCETGSQQDHNCYSSR